MRHNYHIPFFILCMFFYSEASSQGYNMQLVERFNPSNPNLSNEYYSALWGYVAPDGNEYAILGAYNGTYFYHVTIDSGCTLVGFIPTPIPNEFGNLWREMKTYSHYAYIVSEASGSGVQIVDLRYLPDSVHYIGKYTPLNHTRTHTISQFGPYLYLNGSNGELSYGISVLDISSNPEQPVLRGKWDEFGIHDSRVENDTIWACTSPEMSVIDATNKDSLRTIVQWVNAPFPASHNCALTPDGKYLYLSDERTNPPGKLKIWNVQDFENIVLENTWAPNGFQSSIIHNVEIYDTIAVVAYYSAGVRVLNISDPVNPQEVAWYDTFPDNNNATYDGCWAVYMFPSGLVIASDRKYGLYILYPQLIPFEGPPQALFMASSTSIEAGDNAVFLDMSLGFPNTWQWTITGNENFSSNLQNPAIEFNQVGQYTVKLRVGNSLGTDSITKTNYITVTPTSLHPFSFNYAGIQTVYVSPNDTNTVTYRWSRSATASGIRYKFRAQKFGSTSQFILNSSDNSGRDTTITLRKSYLDSVAAQFGTTGDSVLLQCKAYAYNGFDSLGSGNFLVLNVKRTKVGINLISSEIPGEFKLENNYPNPFNPETTIMYQLPKFAFVSIKLYDITGRKISTLVNEQHQAGYYDFNFNASYLTSGVYFYRIQAGEFTDIKRMVLVK